MDNSQSLSLDSKDKLIHEYMSYDTLPYNSVFVLKKIVVINYDIKLNKTLNLIQYKNFRSLYPYEFNETLDSRLDYEDDDYVTPVILIDDENKKYRIEECFWLYFCDKVYNLICFPDIFPLKFKLVNHEGNHKWLRFLSALNDGSSLQKAYEDLNTIDNKLDKDMFLGITSRSEWIDKVNSLLIQSFKALEEEIILNINLNLKLICIHIYPITSALRNLSYIYSRPDQINIYKLVLIGNTKKLFKLYNNDLESSPIYFFYFNRHIKNITHKKKC